MLETSKVLQYLSLDPKIQVMKGDADLSTKGYGSCETEEDQKEKKDEFILILVDIDSWSKFGDCAVLDTEIYTVKHCI